MNSGKRSKRAGSVTLHDRMEEWRRLLDRCGRKPTRKRVHALRVVTLRLQAGLEIDVAELPRASHQAQAILQFINAGEKLRKMLGPVRELDVWLGKLQGLRASLAETTGYVPRSTRECIRQLERFESRLRERRRPLEKRLAGAITKRGSEFTSAAEELKLLVDRAANESAAGAATSIHARFAGIASHFPAFDAENLHEFRKRIKMIRYLAEFHEGDRACAQIALQMKKLQSAIGEWHDWQALGREIQRGRSKDRDAAELINAIAAESLHTALAACHTITNRLIVESAIPPDAGSARKAPLRAHPDWPKTSERKLA